MSCRVEWVGRLGGAVGLEHGGGRDADRSAAVVARTIGLVADVPAPVQQRRRNPLEEESIGVKSQAEVQSKSPPKHDLTMT